MAGLQDVWVKRIGEHRGAPRIFLDAAQAARAGFSPGEAFEIDVDGTKVILKKNRDGSRTVASRKRRGTDELLPVIDINSKDLLSIFEGMTSVRVVVGVDAVYILPLASELKKRERFARLVNKITGKKPLLTASLSHGGGILSNAIHEGLRQSGVQPSLAFANELREDLITQACEYNDAWHADDAGRTAALVAPMQELIQDDWLMKHLPMVEIMEMGLPCSGASKAGKSKNELTMMEDHEEVGHLVHAALVILEKTQPALVLLENVVDYSTSASAQILRRQLRDMGYTCHEAILDGKDFNSMEARVRWALVAVTAGVDFSFEGIAPPVRLVRTVSDILDPSIADDDPRYRSFAHLKDKAARDKADGKGFKMQIIDREATSLPTLRKGYHKGGTTDPLLPHPTDPNLLRLLTPKEHAASKGIPAALVDGMSDTQAHQLLGQSVIYDVFVCAGKRAGECLRAAAEQAAERGLATLPTDSTTDAVTLRRERMTG